MMQRKLVVVRTLNQLVKSIGRFGVNYYGLLYEYFIGFMEHTISVASAQTHGKRHGSFVSDTFQSLHKLIMESVDLLFKNDKKGFVDNLRFEKSVKPITGQLRVANLTDDFFPYAMNHIVGPLMSLVSLVNDDYMWKTILYQICVQLRTTSTVVRKVVASTCIKFIDQLAEKFVVILNDFIPFLSEMIDDEETEISAIAKGMVKQLAQYTSEDIFAMIKAST